MLASLSLMSHITARHSSVYWWTSQ